MKTKIWYHPKYNEIFLTDKLHCEIAPPTVLKLTQADIDEMMNVKGYGEAWLKRCGFTLIGSFE